ncbi:MAG: molecular chaperone DnaK [Cyclobacterium sp.]|nr:molecular chaperone DnaK [Cyclobacterium sp.]
MKISKKDFEEMQKKYKQEVGKGKPGKNPKGDVTKQTEWVFFDRDTLQNLLDQADQDGKTGGIKFYLTEYTEELAKKWHPTEPNSYSGGITLVLKAANLKDGKPVDVTDSEVAGEEYENRGIKCPPTCQ